MGGGETWRLARLDRQVLVLDCARRVREFRRVGTQWVGCVVASVCAIMGRRRRRSLRLGIGVS